MKFSSILLSKLCTILHTCCLIHHRYYHLLWFHHSLIFLNIALLTYVMKQGNHLAVTLIWTQLPLVGVTLFQNPSWLKCWIYRRIKVCAGCKGQHFKNADNDLLSPPHDICLGHKESLSFINPHTGKECFKLGNAYHHINLDCIRKSIQVHCGSGWMPHELQDTLWLRYTMTFCKQQLGTSNESKD